jgi:hypothetical protein
MRADFGGLFAASPASLRRDPTAQEVTGGLACGAAGRDFWNEMLFAESSLLSEAGAALAVAGITADETLTTQLAQALSRGVWLGQFGGSANALTASIAGGVQFPSLLPGMRFAGMCAGTNTGPATLALAGIASGTGAASSPIPFLRRDGGQLAANDFAANQPFAFMFDGTSFRLTTPTAQEVGLRLLYNDYTAGTRTWQPQLGVKLALVWLWGAGGGGGPGNGSAQSGGGGASGSFCARFVSVDPTVSYAYTLGAAGTGGAVGGPSGASGGASSITIGGVTLTALGGGGGLGGVSGAAGGVPANATGGQINITGSQGGFYTSASLGGYGGSAPRGGGGSGPGNAGNQPGGGGGGGSVNQVGAIGANGGIEIWA